MEKKPKKPRPKLKKACILYIYREYLLYLQSSASGSFLQKCNNFVEQQLKYSHFKGSIIPLLSITMTNSLQFSSNAFKKVEHYFLLIFLTICLKIYQLPLGKL